MSLSPHIRRAFWVIIFALPTLAAASWTCYPAVLAAVAVYQLDHGAVGGLAEEPAEPLEAKRRLQKHFRDYHVYVPMEDIVIGTARPGDPSDVALLMQKACGRGRLYIWIPFKFNLPIIGVKVFEWCWKPQTQTGD